MTANLDFSFDRETVAPSLAATVLILREHSRGGFEILCVRRSAGSKFLGGAVVFPGGKVAPEDGDPNREPDETWRTAACRETLEEAAIALFEGREVSHDEAVALQAELGAGTSYSSILTRLGVRPGLGALTPFARWVTPIAEKRRFDTMFYLVRAPFGQQGNKDATETDDSFWATPSEVLARFHAREIALVPPTHRSLEILAQYTTIDEAFAAARAVEAELLPICPELVKQVEGESETLALALPGDPAHSIREARSPGLSRYVLRNEQWLPEEAPPSRS